MKSPENHLSHIGSGVGITKLNNNPMSHHPSVNTLLKRNEFVSVQREGMALHPSIESGCDQKVTGTFLKVILNFYINCLN